MIDLTRLSSVKENNQLEVKKALNGLYYNRNSKS